MTSLVECVVAKVKQTDVENFVMCSLCNLASMIQGGGGASPVGGLDNTKVKTITIIIRLSRFGNMFSMQK